MKKSLKLVIAKINKEHGEMTIGQVKDMQDIDIERIPSGSNFLDYCMGGGFPTGRVVELYGPESAGKSLICLKTVAEAQKSGKDCVWIDAENCIDGSSEIFDPTTGESRTIKEIVQGKKKQHVISLNEKTKTLASQLVVGGGKVIKEAGYCFTTKLGKKIQTTPDHPILTYDGWKKAKHITKGDFFGSPRLMDLFGKKNCPLKAKILGYMLGDGHIAGKGSLTFHNKNKSVMEDFTKAVNQYGGDVKPNGGCGCSYRIVFKNRGGETNENIIQKMFSQWKLRGTYSNTKFIPKEVFGDWNKESVKNLIKAMWMADGTVHNSRTTLNYSTTSKKMAHQLQHLLIRFGIVSYISTHKDKRKESYFKMYKLSINGWNKCQKFLDKIDLIGDKRKRLLRLKKLQKIYKPTLDEILPGYKNSLYRNRDKYLNHSDIYWDKVVGVKKTQITPCDLSVSGHHNFVANGIIVHNSFDPEFATKCGIDVDKLILSQSSIGEYTINMMAKLLEGKPDIIVLDSVASIIPLADLNEPMEQATMATRARLMSRGLAKLNTLNKKTLIMLVNQIRVNIGAYGNPIQSTGGKAIGHYSSVRVEVRHGQILTRNKKNVGQEVKFKIKKSKVSKPFGQGVFNFSYETCGIDVVNELTSIALLEGKVKRSGAYYEICGKKFQGRDKLEKELNKNKEFYKTVKKEVNL